MDVTAVVLQLVASTHVMNVTAVVASTGVINMHVAVAAVTLCSEYIP